MFGLVVL